MREQGNDFHEQGDSQEPTQGAFEVGGERIGRNRLSEERKAAQHLIDQRALERIRIDLAGTNQEPKVGYPSLQMQKAPVEPNVEVVNINGENFEVEYVPKAAIAPAFGYGGGKRVQVREDLPPAVKRFVKAHELYHSTDKRSWGGWIGREIRANFVPALKDPVGFLATARATLFSRERIKFYLDRFRNRY